MTVWEQHLEVSFLREFTPLCALCCCVLLQMVMGGRYYSISPDEYVFAALNIYLVSTAGALQARRTRHYSSSFVSSCCAS